MIIVRVTKLLNFEPTLKFLKYTAEQKISLTFSAFANKSGQF